MSDIDRLRRLALEGDREAAWALAREAVQRQDEALLAVAADALGKTKLIKLMADVLDDTICRVIDRHRDRRLDDPLLEGLERPPRATRHPDDAVDAMEQAMEGRSIFHEAFQDFAARRGVRVTVEQAPPTIAEVYEEFAAARGIPLTDEERARAFSREVVRQAAVVTPGWREELGGWAGQQLGAELTDEQRSHVREAIRRDREATQRLEQAEDRAANMLDRAREHADEAQENLTEAINRRAQGLCLRSIGDNLTACACASCRRERGV